MIHRRLAFLTAFTVVSLAGSEMQVEDGLARAEMVRLAYPGLAKELLQQTLAVAGRKGRGAYFEAAIEYATDIKDWEEAARWVRRAKDEEFVTLNATQTLLDRLFVTAPALACDLFAELLANLPAAPTKPSDVHFLARYLQPLAVQDQELLRQAGERLAAAPSPDSTSRVLHRDRVRLSTLEQALQQRWAQVLGLKTLQSTDLIVIHFAEPWCPPCKREAVYLNGLKSQLSTRDAIWLDLGLNSAAAKEFSVEELPTSFILVRGHLRERLTGQQPEDKWRELLVRTY